jgi:hypothetical protein
VSLVIAMICSIEIPQYEVSHGWSSPAYAFGLPLNSSEIADTSALQDEM